jgi:hypothetical protein
VDRGRRRYDLAEYLSESPLRFHLADGSLLEGCQLFEASHAEEPFEATELMEAVNWTVQQVDPYREFGSCTPPLRSVHDWLGERLFHSTAPVVFYDHRPGECADFLTLEMDAAGQLLPCLYHCKGAGGEPSGNRDADLFEVCGQVTKSVRWRNKKALIKQVKSRLRTGSIFRKGDLTLFLNLLESSPRYEFPLQIYIVQPGLSIGQLSAKSATLLATASRGLVANGCERLRVIGTN